MSSSESSVITVGTFSFATNPFREISLNELTDHNLGPCSSKPIFCSTPSADSVRKREHALLINDPSSPPPSLSTSGILSTFQKELNSPEKPIITPPHPASTGQEEPDLHPMAEPSVDLSLEPNGSSCREDAKSLNEESKSGSSSHFVSAAGGLEWLIDALKKKCVTNCCTVKLMRLDNPAATQLCGQTTYLSSLENSSSVHSRHITKQLQFVEREHSIELFESSDPSLNHHPSTTIDKTDLKLFNSSVKTALVTQSHSDLQSAEHSFSKVSVEHAESPFYVEFSHQTDSNSYIIMDIQSPTSSTIQTLIKNCSVHIEKMALPELQLKGVTQQEDTSLVGAKRQSVEPETGEKETVIVNMLKKKCLTDNCVVRMKRETVSQLKQILKLKDRVKSPSDVSDSTSDDETKTEHPSEKDRREDTTSTEDKTTSDTDAVKTSCNVVSKRTKTSLALKEKKRRSLSTNQPGTTRKACVSGMSVSRWKTKGSTHIFRGRAAQKSRTKAVDCSINELLSDQHKQTKEMLGSAMNFCTPVKASYQNCSSLVADLTPNTHNWSRLKAALSVHRKGIVLLTPRSVRLSESGYHKMTDLEYISRDLFSTPFRTPLSRHLQSQLMSQHSLSLCDDGDLSDAEKVYAECEQQRPLPWEECILPHRMKQCVKIGEGTFGEVFSTTNSSGDTVVLKIIPVEGTEKVNGEDQKTCGEILHEIIISKELSRLKEKQHNQTPGFIGLNDLHCVQGCYPPEFLKAWDRFDKRKGSENDRPDFFGKDQLFIILEFEFGGTDLENSNGTLTSLGVAKSILHQVTAALAVAEQELHFEHRDLHWGNVLVKTTKQKTGSFLLNGTAHSLETKGVLVRIIDYSLSRLEIDDLMVSCDISNDEELFMGEGDYQFDIYRLMRQENGNNWSDYHPHTNVLWLHYLCSKLLAMKYRSYRGKAAKDFRKELTGFYNDVLLYNSATDALQNCPMFQQK
ncbi:uncharacterized protein haspin [Pholidichthys leucotaenia]